VIALVGYRQPRNLQGSHLMLRRSQGSGLPVPVTGRSLRAPALRSLHAGYASPSWLRLPPSPAPGHGNPRSLS